jgi:hypothetical protein
VSIVAYGYCSADILSVSVFGKSSSDLVIIQYDNHIDIIDISGSVKNPDYSFSYIQKYGKDRINNLIIADKQYRNMALYNKQLVYCDVNSVYLPYDTYILEDTLICDTVPKYFNTENISAQYNLYGFSAECEKSEVYIDYGNFIIKCSDKIYIYENNSEIMSSEISDYLTLKTDGISKAEFER